MQAACSRGPPRRARGTRRCDSESAGKWPRDPGGALKSNSLSDPGSLGLTHPGPPHRDVTPSCIPIARRTAVRATSGGLLRSSRRRIRLASCCSAELRPQGFDFRLLHSAARFQPPCRERCAFVRLALRRERGRELIHAPLSARQKRFDIARAAGVCGPPRLLGARQLQRQRLHVSLERADASCSRRAADRGGAVSSGRATPPQHQRLGLEHRMLLLNVRNEHHLPRGGVLRALDAASATTQRSRESARDQTNVRGPCMLRRGPPRASDGRSVRVR